MEKLKWPFRGGNVADLVDSRRLISSADVNKRLQFHSSLIQRLALEKELEGHLGCVNSIAWNSKGSLLVSGSDDTKMNIWSYTNRELLHSIETGHSANIFCTKFVPETSDEVVVSGAGDFEVRVFNLSHMKGKRPRDIAMEPTAVYNCHSMRVKKLAVEIGNPYVVWSASEDGTLRQHDFRECSSCPPAGSHNQMCRNVLIDLRSGYKKTLDDLPKGRFALKSCDISSVRPHQLLVGGSDAFARLYDRRMLPPLSACQVKSKPPEHIELFCPLHLSDLRNSSLHLSHVAFSPNGEEVVLSYSGEHVYLMDVGNGKMHVVRYSADDLQKQLSVPSFSKETVHCSVYQPTMSANKPSRKYDLCKKLLQAASESLDMDADLSYGIEACNEVLVDNNCISYDIRHDCLCIRAALYLKRKWKNDVYMAIRDCNEARSIINVSFKANYIMAEALLQLGRLKEASEYAEVLREFAKSDSSVMEEVQQLQASIVSAEAVKKRKDHDGSVKCGAHRRRLHSLSDLLFTSDVAVSSHQDNWEDSDYDEEMEINLATSDSADGFENEGGVARGKMNLVKGDSRAHSDKNGSLEFRNVTCQPELAVDMKQRYVGHCNVGTDIKQASFLGEHGQFIASGSDDGRWFIWEKKTGRLIKMLVGDEAVVNCIQPHPYDCTVATSGIDNTVKIWSPHAQCPSMVAGGAAGPEHDDIISVIENNQRKLSRNSGFLLPFELLEQFSVHEFAEGTLHPFECAQS